MKRLIFTVMLLLPCLWLGAQSQRERELLNQDWLFAKGHAANPEKDVYKRQVRRIASSDGQWKMD